MSSSVGRAVTNQN